MLERFGVEFASQSKEIKEKTKATNRKRYGKDYTFQVDEFIKKAKLSNLEKYGVEVASKSEIIKEKMKATNLERYNCTSPKSMHIVNFDILNDINKFSQIYNSFSYVFEIAEYFNVAESTIIKQATLANLPAKFNKISKPEQQVADFITSHQIVLEQSNRKLCKFELDIFVGATNMAIEFNGIRYHSSKFKDKNYHLHKTEMCEAKGIQLIHIFEDEWNYKQDIVKSRLLALLGKSNRIYARKCTVVEIDTKQNREFMNTNHIQGHVGASVKLGLEYNGELVSVMTFGKSRFDKSFDYELLRFCNKLNSSVVGGASKLMSCFDKKYNSPSVISYADRRWSQGNLYKQLGFTHSHNSAPNFFLVEGNKRVSRQKYQKHKLSKLFENVDMEMTAEQITEMNNIYRIYDSGNMVWCRK